jgi:hypothetical protein
MTLEEAIKHCEEVAEESRKEQNYWLEPRDKENMFGDVDFEDLAQNACDIAEENEQLAEWLKTLKEIWDSGDCNDCRNGQCEWKPKLGQLVRFNCPHYVGIANGEVNADDTIRSN